ncbi:spermatogenesis-associated protein 24 isoform X2 [Vombatus ursinus]|uniref:spermatogenesis-associated protein 24 isoform X2 n=1 Tax=Vombatus ursinus TaxID=29139 RepID=UPI000FFDBEE6|nr:spermatogenesis-associated protein 24 isoform X2 [Vombatus ursinus]
MAEALQNFLEDENTVSFAFRQLRDVIGSQEQVIHRLKSTMAIQEEKFVSKEEYEAVVKKLEVEVLSKQLEREKQAFEKALSSVKNKVLTESTKKDKLITKCNEIENHIIKQEDILNGKENEIKELQNVISHQKQIFRHQISDFRIQKQQENYMAQVLDRKQKKAGGLLSTRGFKGLGDK